MIKYKTYKLGDICDLVAGFAFKSKDFGDYPNKVVKIADIQPPVVSTNDLTGVDMLNYDTNKLCKYIVTQGDYVLAMTGATIGKLGRITNDIEAYINQRVLTFRPNESIVDKDYLYYQLCSVNFSKYVLNHIDSETAQPNISAGSVGGYEISLPSLEEQRRIAGILGAIDDKIENNRRINTNLECQAQALFEEWLGKIPTTKGVFNDIIKTTIAGDWGQENKQGNYTHEVFCIRGADIPSLRNGDKGKMPIRYILEKNYNTKQLQANDIVVEISGGSPTQSTGRVCMVTQSLLERLGKDLVCTNFCRAITPKDNYAIFIFLYWQMLYNKNTMFSYENGTTGIKNFNIADFISKEEIEIPSSNDVEKLNAVLQPMYNQIYANGLQNETLATLRDTLLPKLMNGEIQL